MAILAMAGSFLSAQLINPGFVYETPDSLLTQPDLDGDGVPDLVVVDRASGVVRPGLESGGTVWLEPVPGGIAGVTSMTSGPIENSGYDSIALVAPLANRVNLFAFTGDTLNRSPRSAFNEIFGLGEIAAIEEGNSGTPSTLDLIGFSGLFEPSIPGVRDFLTYNGSEMESYDPGFSLPDTSERGYQRLLLEPGLSMLGFFLEDVDPGVDAFALVYAFDGNFELVALETVPAGAELIQASFDGSGEFQFVFHEPGSDRIICFAWGGGLNPVGDFGLNNPALRLYPYVSGGAVGLLALSMDASQLEFYTFDGFNPPTLDSVFSPSSGEPVSAALVREDESLVVFSGPEGGDPNANAELFEFDGSEFVPAGDISIPSLSSVVGGSNVLLFGDTPFINPDAPLTGRLGSGVWTSAVAVGADVEVESERFGGTAAGLQDPTYANLGTPPPDTSDALINQVDADISLYDRSAAVGALPGNVTILPDPGTFNESVSVEFLPSDPGLDIFFRILPAGGWQSGTGPSGPYFQTFSVQYFAQAADGRRTPIQTASYTITEDPSDLDSDADGVPDYVEIDVGLDPVASGDDGDGDGFSDLIELLAGSDPADPGSVPPSREVDSDGDGFSDFEEALAGTNPGDDTSFPASPGVLNFQNVFDLLAVPYSHDGTGAADPFVPSLDKGLEIPGDDPLATSVRLYNPAASLIGFDRTALYGLGGVSDPAAYLDEIAVLYPDLFLVVAAERTFNIDVAATDRRLGRQIAALVKFPETTLNPVPYTFGSSGGSTNLEAAAWVSSAQTHYLSQTRPLVVRDFDLYDTLSLLLTELKIEQILNYRGMLASDPLTLTGFRSSETAVPLSEAPGDGSLPVIAPASTLDDLRHKFDGLDSGYLLDTVCTVIEECVKTDPFPPVLALRSVAEEIYRISAATANDNPGTLLPPLDALRQFIRTGSLLNTGYLADPEVAPLDAATLASASTAVPYILGKQMMRPVEFRELRLTSTPGPGCTVLEDTSTLESVSLIDFQGNPYPLPDAFELPLNTRLVVEGYADVVSDCGADVTLEVIPPLDLVFLPVASAADANGNLIPDDLEDLYPASLDPFGDSDGDGYSDLEETIAGTSPLDEADFPVGDPVDLSPPIIAIDESGGTTFTFSFDFPSAYADSFAFRLYSGSDLDSMTTDTGLNATHIGGGVFQLTINKPVSYPVFYRFKMLLD
jgi:hypothetical protein